MTTQLRVRLAMAAVALSVAFSGGCDNRDTVLVIENPTPVYSIVHAPSAQDPSSNVHPGNVIVTLQAGETTKAIGVYHGTDHDAFHVKLPDGTEGLVFAGETFKVVSR